MFRASTIGVALVALACATGCGAGGAGSDVKLVAASRPDTALVAAVPEPFDPAARQASNTFVGKIGRAGWAYVAVVTRGRRALVYLCDGRASEWFGASVRGGRLFVRSFNGTVVDARVQAGAVRGTVQPRGQSAGAFVAARPSGPGIGLFQGPDPAVPRHIRRWIVLADGVRGVSDPPPADVVSGSGTATKGTTTSAAPPTATQPPAADVGAGSGNATRATTTAAAPPTTVRTVTAPTATTTTTRSTTSLPSPSTVSDGTSNTIIIGDASTTPPGDGSVRTVGTATARSTTAPLGDGSVRTLAPTSTTQTTTTPAATQTTITPARTSTTTTPAATLTTTTRTTTAPQSLSAVSDGTSNTIIIGETSPPQLGDGSVRTVNPTTTAASTTATSSSISDGTSNTIVLGVDPINGIAAGASPPPIPPAPPVTTCPVLQPCPPALPASIAAAPAGVKTIGLTPGGQPNLLPGGGLIDCRTLTALIASLAAAARQGDGAAIKQLGVLVAQAKANRC